jgi:hypothetical protein
MISSPFHRCTLARALLRTVAADGKLADRLGRRVLCGLAHKTLIEDRAEEVVQRRRALAAKQHYQRRRVLARCGRDVAEPSFHGVADGAEHGRCNDSGSESLARRELKAVESCSLQSVAGRVLFEGWRLCVAVGAFVS